MITLITGTPGAGKTLYAVKMIRDELVKTGRPVFANINGLKLDHVYDCGPEGPFEWETYGDGCIFVFDEVQHQWPAERSIKETPESVKALDTHRHRGMDIILITQSPMGIDPRVRRLVGRHIHLHRALGWSYSRVMDWPSVQNDPSPPTAYDDGARHTFRFKKDLFDCYKSASVHTVKPRIPWRLLGPVSMVIAILAIIAWNVPTAWATYQGTDVDQATEANPATQCFTIVRRSPIVVRTGDGLRTLSESQLELLGLVIEGNRACRNPSSS